jgi:hypothetical protein
VLRPEDLLAAPANHEAAQVAPDHDLEVGAAHAQLDHLDQQLIATALGLVELLQLRAARHARLDCDGEHE